MHEATIHQEAFKKLVLSSNIGNEDPYAQPSELILLPITDLAPSLPLSLPVSLSLSLSLSLFLPPSPSPLSPCLLARSSSALITHCTGKPRGIPCSPTFAMHKFIIHQEAFK